MLPAGFMLRAPVAEDIPAVTGVVNRCQIKVYGTPDDTEQDVREWFARPHFDPAADSWVVTDAAGTVCGYAYAWQHDPGKDCWVEAWVDPSRAGMGIENHLFEVAEARAAVVVPGGVLVSPIGSVEESMVSLLVGRGYKPTRHDWRMAIDLDPGFRAPSNPDGLVFRNLDPSRDLRTMHRVQTEAFREHAHSVALSFDEWNRWAGADSRFDPSLCFVVFDDDEMVAASYSVDVDETYGWVRTLSVLKPWRARGIGRAMLHQTFERFAARGRTHVMLGVDSNNSTGATQLYESVGMRVVREFDFYEKRIP